MKKKMMRRMALWVMIGLLAACGRKGEMGHTITVLGTGAVTIKPDSAMVNLGVQTLSENVSEAVNDNAAKVTRILDGLEQLGLNKEKNMSVNGYSIYRDYSRSDSREKDRYWVSNNLNIIVQDLSLVGKVIDTAASLGANQMNGIDFSVKKPEDAVRQARELAVQRAREKAELLAKQSGVKVGGVWAMEEIGDTGAPSVRYERAAMADGAVLNAKMSTPIHAGDQTISISVRVVYEIQ